jgi:hypothetical protein
MLDLWKVIDDNGTIHSGTESECNTAFNQIINDEYGIDGWDGDLLLIQVHKIFR